MAWLSGWGKRIEIAINDYAGDIGGAVTWFPATIHLKDTNGQSTKVFLEVGANYRKIAITKVNGETELKGEVEAWNYDAGTPANSTGIIHTSTAGWVIDSNTKVYVYYDKDHADNDNINVIGTTAGYAVYDGNHKAVCHMAGTGETAIDVGSPCIARDLNFGGDATYIDLSNPSNLTGKLTTVYIWAKVSMASAKVATFYVSGGKYTARSASGNLGAVGSGALKIFSVNLDVVEGDFIGIYFTDAGDQIAADNNTGGSGVASLIGDQTACVDATFNFSADYRISLYGEGLDSSSIKDSTSNNNDGVKKGINEPNQVTGKVGLGQDFDGSNDYINLGSAASIGNIFGAGGTFSVCIYPHSDGQGDNGRIVSKYTAASGAGFLIATIAESAGYCKAELYIPFSTLAGWWKTINAVIPINAWSMLTVSYNSSATANDPIFYVNGEPVAITETQTPAGTVKTDAANNMRLGIYDAVNAYDGVEDEIQISTVIRTPAWIKAEYNSLWDTLFTYGDEETTGIILEFSETLSIADTMTTSGTLAKAETLSIVDTKITSGSLEFFETLSIVDSWSGLLTFFETLSITDSKLLTGTLNLTETLGIVDSATFQCIKTFYETLSIIDTITTSGSLNLAETISIVDSWTVLKTFFETLSITDTVVMGGSLNVSEIISIIDSFIRWIKHPIYTEPTKVKPSYTEPPKVNVSYTKPAKSNPIYTKPAKTNPIYTEPSKGHPVYTEPTKEIRLD